MNATRATRAGSTSDVATLAAQHARFLSFLRRRLGNEADAEDVLQAAYVRALASTATLRDRSSIVSWFFQCLKRGAIDHQRRAHAEGKALRRQEAQARRLAAAPASALRAAACACIELLLPRLSQEQADIVRRVDLEGAAPREAAAALGITPGAASVRLHRARAALRAQLEATCGTCTKHKCLDCHCKK